MGWKITKVANHLCCVPPNSEFWDVTVGTNIAWKCDTCGSKWERSVGMKYHNICTGKERTWRRKTDSSHKWKKRMKKQMER